MCLTNYLLFSSISRLNIESMLICGSFTQYSCIFHQYQFDCVWRADSVADYRYFRLAVSAKIRIKPSHYRVHLYLECTYYTAIEIRTRSFSFTSIYVNVDCNLGSCRMHIAHLLEISLEYS